jgi:hypothetical protein
MNKLTIAILLLGTILSAGQAQAPVARRDQFFLALNAGYYYSADQGFKDVYGEKYFEPEAKLGINIIDGFYIWGGFGLIRAKGFTQPELHYAAELWQYFISGGVGLRLKPFKWLNFRLEGGAYFPQFKETVADMQAEATVKARGYRADASLMLIITHNLALEVSAGYMDAHTTINDIPVKLGGYRAGVGIVLTSDKVLKK